MAKPDPQPEALAQARTDEAQLRAQLDAVRRSIAELRADLRSELATWFELDRDLEQGELRRRLRRAEARLAALRASTPQQLGQALLEPARRLRDVGRRLGARLRPVPLDPPRTPRPFDKYERLGAYHWELLKMSWYRDRLEAVADWAEPGFRCLDLGCGDGAAAAIVAGRAAQVTGVDLDARALRLGREQIAQRGLAHVELLQADLTRLGDALGDARYDLVYSLDCIEHLADPTTLLDAIERHTRPGGVVIVGTPLYLCEEAVSPYHVREFTASQLESLLFPRFRTIGTQLLDCPRPDRKGLDRRYYMYVGRARRRWLG